MAMDDRETLIAEWTLVGLSLPFVLLRLWVRGWLQCRLALSDLFVVCAWLSLAVYNGVDIFAWKLGLWSAGIQFTTGPLPNFTLAFPDTDRRMKVLKTIYIEAILYYLSLYFVKGSFLLFYLKLFPANFPNLRLALYFTIVFTCVGAIVTMCVNFFWCLPVPRNWASNQSDLCISSAKVSVYFITVGFHFISDVLIYVLPFFLLRFLRLSNQKVISLILIFSLGILCISCTVARTIATALNCKFTVIAIWGTSECASGIMVACCPPLKWLWHSRAYASSGGSESGVVECEQSHSNTKVGEISVTRQTFSQREHRSLIFSGEDPDDGYDIARELSERTTIRLSVGS